MTPFAERLRELRRERGISQREMAAALGVSGAYLSALEHGRRGMPTWDLLQQIITYLGIIWDDAEELERLMTLSNPRVVVDTAGLHPNATRLANRLAEVIDRLPAGELERLLEELDRSAARTRRNVTGP